MWRRVASRASCSGAHHCRGGGSGLRQSDCLREGLRRQGPPRSGSHTYRCSPMTKERSAVDLDVPPAVPSEATLKERSAFDLDEATLKERSVAVTTFRRPYRSRSLSRSGSRPIAAFRGPHHSRPPSKTGARSSSTFRHRCHRRANGRPRGRAVGSRGGSRGARMKAPHRPSCRWCPR